MVEFETKIENEWFPQNIGYNLQHYVGFQAKTSKKRAKIQTDWNLRKSIISAGENASPGEWFTLNCYIQILKAVNHPANSHGLQ